MKHLVTAVLALALGAGLHAHAVRDPFARPAPPPSPDTAAPEAAAAAAAPPPRLRAIIYTPGRSLANIDGQILAQGEWFGDYQLARIRERSVTLVRNGTKSVLVLEGASRP